MSYSLYLKPAWRTRALETSQVWNSKIVLVLNLVLVVQSEGPYCLGICYIVYFKIKNSLTNPHHTYFENLAVKTWNSSLYSIGVLFCKINLSVYEVKNDCCLIERLFKVKKNGVLLFGISFFVFEIFTFSCYANEESDDVIGGST